MIGIVISGHGQFASGIYSSIQLIAGEQQEMKAVDFKEGMNVESLKSALNHAVEEVEQGDGVVIFTDIPGGTPFNQSVILSTEKNNIKVIAGTNLPAILDGVFSRNSGLEAFTSKVIESGQSGLQMYKTKEKQETDEENGI
ncbi:PTS system mannose-specific EIIAB component [Paraliobacillus sp. PM-2]|uniref:PTS galactosamine/N-acetylgalactosamine transporter subunit IIA n=1 Tax=Paraliobacillus sp. PM-2 TaxID=1462524 RepID=UPI00061BE3B4|nr:PTS galactosamine/N-acetylgalactosamine transporter subunit IIA [Paraliobacillus sp. PM-2]CQR46281.1 PTS system mannose-specific EIIAB component [Paraliobacillus sp. PM-2]